MGDEAVRNAADDVMPCCGHSRRLHTPKCRYWTPGTRIDAPHDCDCEGTPEMRKDYAQRVAARGRTVKKTEA